MAIHLLTGGFVYHTDKLNNYWHLLLHSCSSSIPRVPCCQNHTAPSQTHFSVPTVVCLWLLSIINGSVFFPRAFTCRYLYCHHLSRLTYFLSNESQTLLISQSWTVVPVPGHVSYPCCLSCSLVQSLCLASPMSAVASKGVISVIYSASNLQRNFTLSFATERHT